MGRGREQNKNKCNRKIHVARGILLAHKSLLSNKTQSNSTETKPKPWPETTLSTKRNSCFAALCVAPTSAPTLPPTASDAVERLVCAALTPSFAAR